MAIAPLNLVPTAPASNAFDFSPLAKLGQQYAPQDNTLASLGSQYSAVPTMPTPISAPTGDLITRHLNSIAGIESGGRYDLLGPTTKSGDQAIGKYQIMGANVPEWTKAALGTAMTPDQFRNDPQAQEATARHRWSYYLDKYGADGAAKAWLAGEGGMNNPNARDQLGTSVADYARRFRAGLGD